ncbi:MAG: hypothetical protein LBK73_06725 [Treponema sp.]|jgi:hypothetical protein|nr:hypothetical protein [Treponema sp.]
MNYIVYIADECRKEARDHNYKNADENYFSAGEHFYNGGWKDGAVQAFLAANTILHDEKGCNKI